MKILYWLICLVGIIYHINAQQLKRPEFNFTGVKSEWSYLIINNFKDNKMNKISINEINNLNVSPIIKNDRVICSFNNSESIFDIGSTLLTLNLSTGKEEWINHYNYITDPLNYGYYYFAQS
ncbi:MAG: hypothetical protein ABIO44_04430, partial [Saprospiraceae bacterium]